MLPKLYPAVNWELQVDVVTPHLLVSSCLSSSIPPLPYFLLSIRISHPLVWGLVHIWFDCFLHSGTLEGIDYSIPSKDCLVDSPSPLTIGLFLWSQPASSFIHFGPRLRSPKPSNRTSSIVQTHAPTLVSVPVRMTVNHRFVLVSVLHGSGNLSESPSKHSDCEFIPPRVHTHVHPHPYTHMSTKGGQWILPVKICWKIQSWCWLTLHCVNGSKLRRPIPPCFFTSYPRYNIRTAYRCYNPRGFPFYHHHHPSPLLLRPWHSHPPAGINPRDFSFLKFLDPLYPSQRRRLPSKQTTRFPTRFTYHIAPGCALTVIALPRSVLEPSRKSRVLPPRATTRTHLWTYFFPLIPLILWLIT